MNSGFISLVGSLWQGFLSFVARLKTSTKGSTVDVIVGSTEWYGHNLGMAQLNLDAHKAQILKNACDKIIENRNTEFAPVERITNVPWYMVGALHCRESDLSFTAYLGNGDALTEKTKNVPAGRGPFTSWLAGAVDALEYDGLAGRTSWTIPLVLQLAEKFNGLGYLKHHPYTLSPYLWSFTNLYTHGKYSSDGHFDNNLVDQQPGVAAIILELRNRGLI